MKFFAAFPGALGVIIVLILTGCSAEPNGVGLNVLPGEDSLQVSILTASSTSEFSFLSRVTGSSSTLLVGTSDGIEARMLLSFSGISSIPASAAIDSASLTLRIRYRFRDSTGTLAFEVRKLLHPFPRGKFLWDSTTVAGIYSDTVSGRLIQNVSPLDSTVTVRLDTMLITQWRSTGTGALILIPGGTIIAGVTSPLPELSVSYHDSTPQTFAQQASSGIFVADGIIPSPPERIILQAGITNKAILRFDSLAIPQKASITRAILEVALDSAQSLTNSFTKDNIDAFLERRNSAPYDSVITYGTPLSAVYVNGQKFYRANIKSIVQQWFLHDPNNGILLRASGELTTLDRFILYGTNAAPALRPKLIVTYTLLP